ncbi:MAG TPA: DUF47 family protein [Chloroflexota bacterium]|nr:DUF47 family protein [Chloroflexota bacterium]
MPRFGLVPQTQRFFELFEEDAKNLLAGAKLMRETLDKFEQAPRLVKKLESLEHEGDRITHDLFAELNKTFVTPLDREDIHSLAVRWGVAGDMLMAWVLTIPATATVSWLLFECFAVTRAALAMVGVGA